MMDFDQGLESLEPNRCRFERIPGHIWTVEFAVDTGNHFSANFFDFLRNGSSMYV